jgi:hypothetical protein
LRKTLITLAGIGLALVIAGCTPEPADTEQTPAFSSEDEAFAAAEATYREYVKALNAVDLRDPGTFEGVYAWTTGELLQSDRKSFSGWHANGLTKTGRAHISSVHGSSANHRTGTVELWVCYDVSDVDIVDTTGESLVDPVRPPMQPLLLTLVASSSTHTRLALSAIEPGTRTPRC